MIKQMNSIESILINDYQIYVEDIVSFNIVDKINLIIEVMGSSGNSYCITFEFTSAYELHEVMEELVTVVEKSTKSRCNSKRYIITTETTPIGYHNLDKMVRTIASNPELKKRAIVKYILMPKRLDVPIPPPPAQINEVQSKTYSFIDSIRNFFL